MTEKIKQLESDYLKRIRNMETDFGAKTENSSAYCSLETSEIVKISEEKSQLEDLNVELREKVDELSKQIIKLEKENGYLSETKKLLKEKSRQNFELEDNLNNTAALLKETEQKINSYKFLIADKDRYISDLLNENKNLRKTIEKFDVIYK